MQRIISNIHIIKLVTINCKTNNFDMSVSVVFSVKFNFIGLIFLTGLDAHKKFGKRRNQQPNIPSF